LPPSRWHQKLAERYPSESLVELYRRADDFFYRGLARLRDPEKNSEDFLMQPKTELLDMAENPVDIVACTLIDTCDKKAVIILEDHNASVELGYSYGKSTIMRHLLGFKKLDDLLRSELDLAGTGRTSAINLFERLTQVTAISDLAKNPTSFKILTADITFLARSLNNELVVMAMSGTKEDFIWDTARSAMRYIVSGQDPFLPTAQIELASKLGLDQYIWADTESSYPIKEMIFISPCDKKLSCLPSEYDLKIQLKKNPLYLASRAKYWDIDKLGHENLVDCLLDSPLKPESLPAIKYLYIGNPLNKSDLEIAARKIKQLI